jgi:prepilin-type N-terminal cleavage/methylation domain-containing protein
MHHFRKQGFTLIELLVVLSIILIISGVAVTSVSGFGSPKQQLRREARGLMKLFSEARRTAMIRKMAIDVYVDESSRTVCAIESAYGRTLVSTGEFFERLLEAEEGGIDSSRFVRTVSFPEQFQLEVFPVELIDTGAFDADELFQVEERNVEFEEGEVLAFSFTHFGGASGGGVSLLRKDVRFDIACDVLTGRAAPVIRKESEE